MAVPVFSYVAGLTSCIRLETPEGNAASVKKKVLYHLLYLCLYPLRYTFGSTELLIHLPYIILSCIKPGLMLSRGARDLGE